MRNGTRIDWHRRVDEALIKLLAKLEEGPLDDFAKGLSFKDYAEEVAASPYHFHKQFKALTGETFKACVDRLRLEKAMTLLRATDTSVTEIALECGYSTVEMLSKATRKTWGLSPSRLRQAEAWHPYVPSRVGIHYQSRKGRKAWFYAQGGIEMETKIAQFDEKFFYGFKCQGDYWQLPKLWESFFPYVNEKGLAQFGVEYMSVFPDTAESIPGPQKRAFAGFVAKGKLAEKGDLDELCIPAGLYAVTVHFGSSEAIGPVWERWVKEWLPNSGWEADYSRPNYEWYQNKLDNPELLLTFLVTSVKRKE